jgi:hypothetical protein
MDELLKFIHDLSHEGTCVSIACPTFLDDRPYLIIYFRWFGKRDVAVLNYLRDSAIDIPPSVGRSSTQYLWSVEYMLDSASPGRIPRSRRFRRHRRRATQAEMAGCR